jgi:hypothetical protein
MSDSNINGLVVTGLLAVLGTVTGGVIKGYWDSSLAEKDFQSKLIARALESADSAERVKSLSFLIKTNLITSPRVREGLNAVLGEGEKNIPRFLPVSPASGGNGLDTIDSARARIVRKYPTLQGRSIALIGFRVHHGDIIDGITPVFAEVTPELELKNEYEGEPIGGKRGSETVLKRSGYVVIGFDIQRGEYFGRTEVINFQVVWASLTPRGLDANSIVLSEKLGSGRYAKPSGQPEHKRASANAFVSDFKATASHHTSGETFLNDIETTETVLVPGQETSKQEN